MLISTPKIISEKTTLPFSVDQTGLYSISISARCADKKHAPDGQNQTLRVEIDDHTFREVPPLNKPQYNLIPVSWSGTDTQGLLKTVTFLLLLDQGEHNLTLFPDKEVKIEKITLEQQEISSSITIPIEETAEDGNRRAWHTIALLSLPLLAVEAEASVAWHAFDGDDLKVSIDNSIKANPSQVIRRNWAWSSRPWHKLSGAQKSSLVFSTSLEEGDHYIEFWADRTPTLHQVIITLKAIESSRKPTVDNPNWTGTFSDDSEQMILARAIFGEARDLTFPDQLRVAVAWSIKNRVKDLRWPNSYVEVITQKDQYSAFNEGDLNREMVENPLCTNLELDKTAWLRAYEIAGQVIHNEVSDPTFGANHYHDNSIDPPDYLKNQTAVLTVTNAAGSRWVKFYKL